METLAQHKHIVKTNEIIGIKVINTLQEDLGKIHEIVLNKQEGKVLYVVLESGSFLGMGGKLFALPWSAINYDIDEAAFILNISKEKLKDAPGFDKNNWPVMSDTKWVKSITDYYTQTL